MNIADLHELIFAVEKRLPDDDAFSARELLDALQDEITHRFVETYSGKKL